MGVDKDIIKELRHAEKMGLFESHAQMPDTDTVIDIEDNKEEDELCSTGFLHQDPPYFRGEKLDIDMIFSSVPLPMVFKNHEGVYTVVNELFCELIERKKEKIIGKTDFDLFPERKAKRFIDADRKILANGNSESQIEKFSDSEKKWVRITRKPVIDQGKIVGLICSFMDVTSEKELITSEKKFKLIFENAPDAIYLNDSEGCFVDGNKKAEEIIGYQREELIGKKFSDVALLRKRDIPKALKNLALNKLGKATGPSEFELIRKDGSNIKLEISNFPFNFDGKQMALGIARDISIRKKAERILKDRQIELEQIFEAMPEALVYADKNRKIIRVNSAFEKIYGYKREEVIGEKTKILYANPDEYYEQGEERYNVNVRDKLEPYEIHYRRKNGEIFPSETVGTPVRDAQDNVIGLLGLVQDITERKKVEDKLRSSEEKLKLAMNAAHEGVWEWNLKTNKVFFDEVALEMVGYDSDDFKDDLKKGSWWIDQVHPDDKESMESTFQQFISGEINNYSVEFRLKRKNGGFTWISSNGIISGYDEKGQAEIVVGIHQDITNKKNKEERIKEKQRLLKKGENLANMGSWEWNVKTGIVVCSDQWQRIHGTHKSEYKKDELMQIAHPDDRARVNEAFDKTLKKHVPYDMEHRIIRQNDRKIRLIKAYGEIVEDHNGDGSKIKGYARDISQEKRAEEKFREKFEELQRWKKLTVGRELKMSMLKEENRRLEKKLQNVDGERRS